MDVERYLNMPYRVTLCPLPPDEGGGWFAEIPDLPGCGSDGETQEEALENLRDAQREWILAAIEMGRPIPEPTPYKDTFSGRLLLRMPKSLHRDLTRAAEIEGTSVNQLAVYLLTKGLEGNQQRAEGGMEVAVFRTLIDQQWSINSGWGHSGWNILWADDLYQQGLTSLKR